MLTATLNYTPALVKAAAFGYVRRGLGLGSAIAFAAVIAGAVALALSGPSAWETGAALGAACVLVFLLIGIYLLHYRQGMAKLRRMGSHQATLEFSDASLKVSSGAGSSTLPWTTFSEVWRFPKFWLLIIGQGQYMTLPLADLSPEVQAFILVHIHPRTDA